MEAFVAGRVALKFMSLITLGLIVLFFFLKERRSVYFMSSRSNEFLVNEVFEKTGSLKDFKFEYLGDDGWKMSPKALTFLNESELDKALESLREIDRKILFVEGASNEGREWDGPIPHLLQFREKEKEVGEE